MNKRILLLLLIALSNYAYCQQMLGGEYTIPHAECVSNQERATIMQQLLQSRTMLEQQGILAPVNPNAKMITTFDWPLRKASNLTDPGYYSISNYVDQNTSSAIQDYNCGSITYNGHKGTDIFTWPFSWYKMDNNQVEIVAAAPGTIIYRSNGNFDRSCASNNNNWNAIYIQHSDGSVAWYGHMKNNSITAKAVGQTVVAGEYLGVVGSSGNSTGPHLHFEVYSPSNTLIDPFSGTCNTLNSVSWWNNQLPYLQSGLNKIMTNDGAPLFPACPNTESPNAKNIFCPGNAITFSAYYRNQANGQVVTHKIYRPDSTIFLQWNQTFTAFYQASYWYNNLTLPTNAQIGKWRYEITYLGNTYTHPFVVGPPIVTISPSNIAVCDFNNPITLTANGSDNYLWNNGSTTASISINAAATYTVTSTNLCGSATATAQVTQLPLPTAVITNPSPVKFCAGSSVVLTANTGVGLSYEWIRNSIPYSGFNTPTFNALSGGTYRVKVTDASGCSKISSAKTVTQMTLPSAVISPSGSVSFCNGDSALLTASAGTYTYQWKRSGSIIQGATSQQYYAKAAGTYRVIVTKSNGCTKLSNSVLAQINCRQTAPEIMNTLRYDGITNQIEILCDAGQNEGQLSIMDFNGKCVYTTPCPNNYFATIPSGLLSAGIYMAIYRAENCYGQLKFILEK